ncbi:MAG: acetolactate synthase small subunit, partial [Planctomycetes bacterium]|nr:acetolactate synthase small subunit [Planctomycetota bacterium]
ERDLMLIKVKCAAAQRPEVFQPSESFRGRIIDIQHGNVMIEISGTEGKVEAFIALMRPYGILELARTGRIALVRGEAKPQVAPEGT